MSWVKVLLDLLKLSDFLSLNPLFPKRKIICFLFQTIKIYWVWRKFFEKFITILNVWVVLNSIIRVSFFQLVSIGSFFTEELKILNKNLMQYLYLFILIQSSHGSSKTLISPHFWLCSSKVLISSNFFYFFLISPHFFSKKVLCINIFMYSYLDI